jgi:hypothetical protein
MFAMESSTSTSNLKKTPALISLRVEVSLFVRSPEIEDRNAIEVDNWGNMNSFIYFSFPAVTIFKF